MHIKERDGHVTFRFAKYLSEAASLVQVGEDTSASVGLASWCGKPRSALVTVIAVVS